MKVNIIIFFSILFMFLVIVGLGTIHYTMKIQVKNNERIINRLDLIIKELNDLNKHEPDNEH